jgi:hypothetical protein
MSRGDGISRHGFHEIGTPVTLKYTAVAVAMVTRYWPGGRYVAAVPAALNFNTVLGVDSQVL